VIADAVAEGLIARSGVATEGKEKAAGEPLAEWERDLLEGEKKADEAEKPAEAAAEAPAAEAPEAEAPAAEAPAADAEQA
jgi:small subunit ribosomal protein S2